MILKIGTEKNMTARSVAGFYTGLSARNSGNLLHIWGDFVTKLHRKTLERKEKNSTGEKNSVETAPPNCRFLRDRKKGSL